MFLQTRSELLNLLMPVALMFLRKRPSFCNATITYTHPGWNDTINAFPYENPLAHWNEDFLAVGGGGGFAASFGYVYQTAAVDKEVVAVATHRFGPCVWTSRSLQVASPWVIKSRQPKPPLIEDHLADSG